MYKQPQIGSLYFSASNHIHTSIISMAQGKTAPTPLLTHWSSCSLALSYEHLGWCLINSLSSRISSISVVSGNKRYSCKSPWHVRNSIKDWTSDNPGISISGSTNMCSGQRHSVIEATLSTYFSFHHTISTRNRINSNVFGAGSNCWCDGNRCGMPST